MRSRQKIKTQSVIDKHLVCLVLIQKIQAKQKIIITFSFTFNNVYNGFPEEMSGEYVCD